MATTNWACLLALYSWDDSSSFFFGVSSLLFFCEWIWKNWASGSLSIFVVVVVVVAFLFLFFRCRLLQGLGNVDHLLRAADSLPLETLQSFQDAIDSETTLDLLNKVWLDNA